MQDATPTLEQLLAASTDWLLGAVTTEEASCLLSIPVATLETWRSRKSDGPCFVRVRNTRIIRYIRLELYRWLLADGMLEHTGGIAIPVAIPLGKLAGSAQAPSPALPVKAEQGRDRGLKSSETHPVKPDPTGARSWISNSSRKPPGKGARR